MSQPMDDAKYKTLAEKIDGIYERIGEVHEDLTDFREEAKIRLGLGDMRFQDHERKINEHGRLLVGEHGDNGLRTRVRLLEHGESNRGLHLKTLWGAVLAAVGTAAAGWFLK